MGWEGNSTQFIVASSIQRPSRSFLRVWREFALCRIRILARDARKKCIQTKIVSSQNVLIRYSTQNSCGNFHRETANPPRVRLSPINSEFESEHATTASAGNARLKRSLRKFCLRLSDQKAEHPNFASVRPGKTRSTQILEFDHVPRSPPSPSFDGASRLTFSLVES